MLSALRQFIGRFPVVGVMLLTLAFAAPAFESHACADEAPAAVQTFSDAADADEPCPDCGPACAEGCCHAPHPAVTGGDPAVGDPQPAYAAPRPWTHSLGLPMGPPDGPERPPRA